MSNFDILKNILDAQQDTSTKAYDTTATVRRIEGSTAWVHIPGGVDETPVRLTINAKAGDTVQLRVGGGSAWIVGNQTAPPTDDTKAEAAQITAETAHVIATKASTVATSAKKIADNTNQYFWMVSEGDDTGAHITEVTQDEFLADPDNGGGNLLARSNGIAIRDGMVELASFSTDGIVLGKPSAATTTIGNTYTNFSNTFYVSSGSTTDTFTGDGETVRFRLSSYPVSTVASETTVKINGTTISDGYTMQRLNSYTIAGYIAFDTAPDNGAVITVKYADGNQRYASVGSNSDPLTAGNKSFIVGYGNPSGDKSMVQGNGCYTEASNSLACGLCSIAASTEQVATGRYNVKDADDTYAFIIGNGDSSARSNALTVDWDGNVQAAGQVKSTTETYSLTLPSAVYFGGGLVRNGGVAMLSIINISKLPRGQTTLCTLPEGWRPPISVMSKFEAPDSSAGPVRLFINSSGVVTLYNYGAAITALSNISDTITYVLA